MKNTIINKTKVTILPIQLHSIFIGIMLSDGGLYKSSPTSNVRFEMSFGEKYSLFAKHIELLFFEFINTPLKKLYDLLLSKQKQNL